MDVRDCSGRTVLVTGAASGIGRETAYAFGARGAELAICDVDEAGLKQTEERLREMGREVLAVRTDVADADSMRAFADAVHARVPAVDVLVNNAGVGLGAGFLDTTLEDWDWITGINLRGVVHGCHFFLPKMVERGRGGHVVNVASAAGFYASEALTAYSATKFAVLGLSEALSEELARYGIGVTCICPGIINTPITRSSPLRGRVAEHPEARQRMIEAYERRNYTPARVAANILRAVQKDRLIAPVSPEAWAIWIVKRLSPRLLRWFSMKVGARSRRQMGLE